MPGFLVTAGGAVLPGPGFSHLIVVNGESLTPPGGPASNATIGLEVGAPPSTRTFAGQA